MWDNVLRAGHDSKIMELEARPKHFQKIVFGHFPDVFFSVKTCIMQ